MSEYKHLTLMDILVFKPFEDTLTLVVTIISLVLCGVLGVAIFVNNTAGLSSKIVTVATFASGLGTILAVLVAWKAKNQWFSQKHYEQKNLYFSHILDLYRIGLDALEFAFAAEYHLENTKKYDDELKLYAKQILHNYRQFNSAYQNALKLAFELEVNQSQYHGKIMHQLVDNFKQYAQLLSKIDLSSPQHENFENEYSKFDALIRSEIIRLTELLFEHRYSTETIVNMNFFGMNSSAHRIEAFLDSNTSG